MSDRSLITAGAIGALLAAICCATPLLSLVLAAIGLTAWMATADYLVIPVLLVGLAVAGLGFFRRRTAVACRDPSAEPGDAE